MPFEAWKPTEVSWQAASNFLPEPEVELGLQELLDYVAPYFEAHILCLSGVHQLYKPYRAL